jgi:DNA repair ATPase RecN
MIEKQYRNRLNVQFESLLEILPKRGEDEKRVGKAEVLTNANRYIQQLEKSIKKLEEKNVGLEGSVRDLTKRWGATGEEEIPRNRHSIC